MTESSTTCPSKDLRGFAPDRQANLCVSKYFGEQGMQPSLRGTGWHCFEHQPSLFSGNQCVPCLRDHGSCTKEPGLCPLCIFGEHCFLGPAVPGWFLIPFCLMAIPRKLGLCPFSDGSPWWWYAFQWNLEKNNTTRKYSPSISTGTVFWDPDSTVLLASSVCLGMTRTLQS